MTAMAETKAQIEPLGSWTRTGEKQRIFVNLAAGVELSTNRIVGRQQSAVGGGFKLARPKTSADSNQSSRLKVKTPCRFQGFLLSEISGF